MGAIGCKELRMQVEVKGRYELQLGQVIPLIPDCIMMQECPRKPALKRRRVLSISKRNWQRKEGGLPLYAALAKTMYKVLELGTTSP